MLSRARRALFLVKPSTFRLRVAHGAADIGVVGMTFFGRRFDVYAMIWLWQCRMAVAAQKGFKDDTAP